ncbi:MAG: pLS20_p028 family conjugation system transmembrane protein [Staphylococcus equorum]
MNFILGDMSNMGNPGLDPANTEQINNHVASSSKLSDKDILGIFNDYADSLEITNIVTSMFRTIGWYFVQFLVWITDLVSNLAINVLTLFGLLSQDSITKLLIEAKPVLISILALSIMYIGFKMMTGRQVNKANIFTAIIVAIIFLGSLNSTIQTGSELAKESSKAVENFDPDSSTQSDDGSKAGSSLLKKNIIDIQYMAEKDFPKLKTTRNNSEYNKLTAKTAKYIDINEGIDAGDVKSKNAKKVLGKKISVDENGKTKLVKLSNGMFGIGEEQYYRFQVKWFTAIVGLICLALGHFLAALRVASIILELVVTKIIAVGFSYALQGEKLKSTIVDIINGFISIVLIFVCLFIFKEVVGFLNDKPLGVWFIGLIAATFFMIDGPKVIERKFGYDAGLSSPWRSALAMYGAAKAGAGVAGSGIGKASDKIKQSHSNSNKTNSNSNEKSNNETNSRSEALNQQSSNSKNNQESNTRSNGERNLNEQQTATTNVGNETNSRTNQEAQEKQNSETQDVNNRQSANSQSSNTHQTLDQEMKESGHGTNDFKGVGAGHSALWANKPASGSSSLMSEENLQNVEKQINNGGSSSNTTTNTPTSAESINNGGSLSNTTTNTPTSAESINNGTTGNAQSRNTPLSSEATNREPQNTPKQANGFTQQRENQKPLSSNQNKGNSQYHRPKSPMSANRNNGQNRTPSQKASINRGNTGSTQSNRTHVNKPSNSNKTVNQPKQVNSVKSTNSGSNRSARPSNGSSNRSSKPTPNRPVNKQRINPKR